MQCKTVRLKHSARPKIRLTESGTDLITILRCFLSFKLVITSRNIIVFKIKLSLPKHDHLSWCTLFNTSCLQQAPGHLRTEVFKVQTPFFRTSAGVAIDAAGEGANEGADSLGHRPSDRWKVP